MNNLKSFLTREFSNKRTGRGEVKEIRMLAETERMLTKHILNQNSDYEREKRVKTQKYSKAQKLIILLSLREIKE